MIFSCKGTETADEEVNCIGDYSTDNVLTNINSEIFNNDESVNAISRYSWTSNGSQRILSGNGIPNHEVGTFPNNNNPNTIREINVFVPSEVTLFIRDLHNKTGLVFT